MTSLPMFSSVRGQIVVGFGLLVLIVVTGAAGSVLLGQAHRSDMSNMESRTTTASLLEEAQLDGTVAMITLQSYVITGDETLIPNIRAQLASATRALTKAIASEDRSGHDEQAAALRQAAIESAPALVFFDEIIERRQSGDVAAATSMMAELLELERLQDPFAEAAEEERQEVAALQARADRTANLAFWFAIIAGVTGAVLGLAASALIARSILKPLSSLESAALAVADGDLEARAPTAGPRELAHLGASLNRMTESLLDASKRRELEAERERAFAQLQDSEERYRALIETSPDVIYTISPDGTLTSVNPAFETVTGWSRDEWIGKSFAPIIHPDDRSLAVDQVQRLLRGEEVPPTTELRVVTKSGEYITGDFASTLQMQKGRVLGVLGIVRDISERKRAEEALRESAILETALDCIITIDHEGRIIEFNPAAEKTFGYGRAEVLGRRMEELIVPPSLRESHRGGLANYLATGEGPLIDKRIETTAMRADGTEFPAEIAITHIPSDGPPMFTGHIRDITERKRAEAAMRSIVEGTSSATGDEFFRSLACNLASALDVRYALVGELVHGAQDRIRTLAVWAGRRFRREFRV